MYRSILVPLDGSDTAERGLREAVRLAHGQGTTLVLLHVIDDYPTMREFASTQPFEDLKAQRRLEAEALLAGALKLAEESGVRALTSVCFLVESTAQSIVDKAQSAGCELIVLGTHGRRGVSRAVLGSVAEAVCRLSPIPVMLIPPASRTESREARSTA